MPSSVSWPFLTTIPSPPMMAAILLRQASTSSRLLKSVRNVTAKMSISWGTALIRLMNRSAIEATLQQGGTVGRPHIARQLVAKGYFPDVKTVFDKLLYRGGPAYVPYHRRSIDDCVALIRQAGGIAVLAHPGLLKRTLDQVLAHDFDGVEVYHPKNRGRYKEFLKLAEDRHWYVSGGSDFHGTTGRFPEKVGVFTVDAQAVKALLNDVKG